MSTYVPPGSRTAPTGGGFFLGLLVGVVVGGIGGAVVVSSFGQPKKGAEASKEETAKPGTHTVGEKRQSPFGDEVTIPDTLSRSNPRRSNPEAADIKSFAKFPEERAGQCLVFSSVWIHGDINRIVNTKFMSPSISSEDGKYVMGRNSLLFASGLVFIMSEDTGRLLGASSREDTKYVGNVYCEVVKQGKVTFGMIYRVELLNRNGNVLKTFEN